jgi:hypothetical protein
MDGHGAAEIDGFAGLLLWIYRVVDDGGWWGHFRLACMPVGFGLIQLGR